MKTFTMGKWGYKRSKVAGQRIMIYCGKLNSFGGVEGEIIGSISTLPDAKLVAAAPELLYACLIAVQANCICEDLRSEKTGYIRIGPDTDCPYCMAKNALIKAGVLNEERQKNGKVKRKNINRTKKEAGKKESKSRSKTRS